MEDVCVRENSGTGVRHFDVSFDPPSQHAPIHHCGLKRFGRFEHRGLGGGLNESANNFSDDVVKKIVGIDAAN